MIVALDRQHREFLPLEMVGVSRFHFGYALPESEDISIDASVISQDPDHLLGNTQIFVPLVFKSYDGGWSPSDGKGLVVNLDAFDLPRHALDQGLLGENLQIAHWYSSTLTRH